MYKRLFALLVATLMVLGVAIPIGAEDSTVFRLANSGTVIAIPTNSIHGEVNVYKIYVPGQNDVTWKIPFYDGAEIKRVEKTTNGKITTVIGKLVATGDADDTYTYFELINVDTTATITASGSRINGYAEVNRFVLLQVIVPLDPEPEVTDPEPEVTGPEPEVTDPDPGVTDPDKPSYDGVNQATTTILQFWTVFFDSVVRWIINPTFAVFDINSPVFSVLALTFSGGVIISIFETFFDFRRK